jgi:hypothetical protein
MKYAIEMGSDVTMYIPDFINTGSGIRKLKGGNTCRHRDTQTAR